MAQYDLSLGDDFGDDDFGDDDFGDDFGDDAAVVMAGRAPRRRGSRGGRSRNSGGKGGFTLVMPFPRQNVTTLAQVVITQFPQRPFITRRFVMGSQVSPFFSCEELKIGQDSMFVQTGSVDMEVFSQTGVSVELEGFAAYPGTTITLTVTNQDTVTRQFSAAIIGRALVDRG